MLKKFTLAAAMLCLFGAASAQNTAEQIEAIDSRVEKLETIVDALPTLSGYSWISYSYGGDVSTFQIRRARVTAKDNIYKDVLTYYLQMAFATAPKVLHAAAGINLSEKFNFWVGETMIPFSLYNTYTSSKNIAFVDHPLVSRKLAGFSDISGVSTPATDIGVQMYGKLNNFVSYKMAVGNGADANTADDNLSKDVMGTLILTPIEPLVITGAYYYGETNDSYAARERWGVGLCYTGNNFFVSAEYIAGITADTKNDGHYVAAGYWIIPKLAPIARYDYMCEDSDMRAFNEETNYTAGLHYRPAKNFSIQVEYTNKTYGSMVSTKDVNQVTALFVAAF